MKALYAKTLPVSPLIAASLILCALVPRIEATNFIAVGTLNAVRYLHTATLLSNGKVLVAGGTTNPLSAVSSFASAEIYDPATGTWTPTSPMSTARYGHTATLLPTGKVLVVGGYGTNGALSSAEIYDPSTGFWSATAPLTTARYQHTATLLRAPNGMVLVTGGTGNNSPFILASSELYNPFTGTWQAGASMTAQRSYHTATLLSNGTVLVAGGQNSFSGVLSSAEIYDPGTGAWTGTGSMNHARDQHTATALPNGTVLVAGGGNGTANLPYAEVYDPASGAWTAAGNLNTAHAQHTASLLPGGLVLVTGGIGVLITNKAELYDPSTGLWSVTSSMNSPRYNQSATVLANGNVLVAGGFGAGAYLASSELYVYIEGGTSSGTGTMTTTRFSHSATLLPNGNVLVAGGNTGVSGGTYLSSAEVYNPRSGSWTTTASMSNARELHTSTLLPDGHVLVAGGIIGFSPLSSSELYDPVGGTWSMTGTLNTGRYLHTATLLPDGKVLVAGGEFSLSSAEVYDPVRRAWIVTGTMNAVRFAHTATLLGNGKVLVAGGESGINVYNSSAELYDPATGLWAFTGGMNSPRAFHTATLLPNGEVLVAGGINSSSTLSSAELYDQNTGTWTVTTPLNNPRQRHTAMLLLNGKVMVAGGLDSSSTPVSSEELFDPATRNWVSSPMIQGRGYFTSTLLPSGLVLSAGGQSLSNSVTIYLSGTETFDGGPFFNSAWQPHITSFNSPWTLGTALALIGNQFTGLSEASGGNSMNSASDYPVLQLRSVEGGLTFFPLSESSFNFAWTDNDDTLVGVLALSPGWTMATMFVNGIRSAALLLNAESASPVPIILTNLGLPPGGPFHGSFTNTPSAVFTALASTNLSLPLSNWTVLGSSVVETSPGNFKFNDMQAISYPRRFYRVRSP